MAMEQIEFNIETQRILKLLANDIYDSPYALLRENVQNAYDAILMRQKKESFEPRIDIVIENSQILIADNGNSTGSGLALVRMLSLSPVIPVQVPSNGIS